MTEPSRNFYDLAAIIIVVFALGLAITSVWNDSPIVDEIPHIGAGYSYIAKGDHRLNPEHPPLAKDLAGISLKIMGTENKDAFESKFWQTDVNGQWEFGRKLIFNSDNDAIKLVRFAKIPQLIFFVLSSIIIYIWARSLYSGQTAIIALFLFSFSPTVLAHSRFVTTDMPALFGVLIATFFFIHYLEKPTKKNLWLAGLIFGVAQLTKFSVFLLVPFFLIIAIIHVFLNSPKSKIKSALVSCLLSLVAIIIGYLFIVWPVYYFHTWNYPPELQRFHTDDLLRSYGGRWAAETVIFLSDKPIIRGLAEYGLGLLMVTQRSAGGNTTYFMGEVRNWAWPQYFPVVYFLKEPLAFWGLVTIVLVFLIGKLQATSYPFDKLKVLSLPKDKLQAIKNWARDHFTELTMLLWIALYWYTSIRSNLNIGVRHLLPVYGFTYILLGGVLVKIINSLSGKKLVACLLSLVALFGWYLFENLKVRPYYLTYFNQTALLRPSWASEGQAGYVPGGHWYVVDSNLDWGQDLKRLADWVAKNNIKNISLDYFGWADQSYYLKSNFRWISAGNYMSTTDFLKDNPEGGYIAISATYYMGSREKPETSYAWLDNYKPITVIGNSIFVWYFPPL